MGEKVSKDPMENKYRVEILLQEEIKKGRAGRIHNEGGQI
jgi:hypothetical protein